MFTQSPDVKPGVRTVLRACLPDGLRQAANVRDIFCLPVIPDGQIFDLIDLYVEILLSMPTLRIWMGRSIERSSRVLEL